MSIGLKDNPSVSHRLIADYAVPTTMFLVDGLGISGKTKSLADLARGLEPSRYRASVCYFTDEISPLTTRLRECGIPVRGIPCKDGLHGGIVFSLARAMREIRPEVVHCYNPRTMLYGGLAARIRGIKATIGTLSAFACLTSSQDFEFLPQSLMNASRRNRVRNRLAARLMSRIVVVSKSLGENWCRYNGIPKSKVQVIPYGTDVEALQEPDRVSISRFRESMGIQPSDFVFGSVGRLVEQKDYPNQIDAFALAVKQMSNLRMVLAGDGPLRADLEAYVRRLNLTQSVRFLGHCDSVPLFLRSVDSFVLASKFEPFGVVIIEAKAAGLPIIATDVNSVRDMLSAGHSGLIVPPGDPTRLAEAMLRVAKYPELRESLGKEALMEVRSQNSLQVAINNYQQLYDAARGVHGRPQF